jgi:hypothetical protein
MNNKTLWFGHSTRNGKNQNQAFDPGGNSPFDGRQATTTITTIPDALGKTISNMLGMALGRTLGMALDVTLDTLLVNATSVEMMLNRGGTPQDENQVKFKHARHDTGHAAQEETDRVQFSEDNAHRDNVGMLGTPC